MDLIMMPWNLFVTYGAIVLGCGAALGIIVGRHLRRSPDPDPVPPELLQQRMALLEQELDATSADLRRLMEEREFMRELRRPRGRAAAA